MVHIGSFNTLPVRRLGREGVFLGADGDEVRLPVREAPPDARIGDRLRVFVYTDSDDRPVATTRAPRATVGQFACLEAIDVTPHGAFLDWGLDKDLFVPFKEQHRRMVVGRRYVVAVALDRCTRRVVGSSRLAPFLDYDVAHLRPDQKVRLLVYDTAEHGVQVIVDGRYPGLVHARDVFRSLRMGEETIGWIRRVRADNKLDVVLQRRGHAGAVDAQAVIVERLRAAGGFLAVHDKCPPEEIMRVLGMSKKTFKRALGGLYKARRVALSDAGTALLD